MRTIGQSLRILGLVIELTGLVGIVRGNMSWAIVIGGRTISWAWLALGLGFVVWLVGTILLAATRPGRSKPPSLDLDLESK